MTSRLLALPFLILGVMAIPSACGNSGSGGSGGAVGGGGSGGGTCEAIDCNFDEDCSSGYCDPNSNTCACDSSGTCTDQSCIDDSECSPDQVCSSEGVCCS